MEAGNSLGCLQQREVVHTYFPAYSGKSIGSVFTELKCPLPTQMLDLSPFGDLVSSSISPGPINERLHICLLQ